MRRLAFVRGPDLGEEGKIVDHPVSARGAALRDSEGDTKCASATTSGLTDMSSSDFYAEVTGLAQYYVVISDDEAIIISDDDEPPFAEPSRASENEICAHATPNVQLEASKSLQLVLLGGAPELLLCERVQTSSCVNEACPSVAPKRAESLHQPEPDVHAHTEPSLCVRAAANICILSSSDTDTDTETDEDISFTKCQPQYFINRLNKGYQILQRSMGWNEKRGLGKDEQGRKVPILPLIKVGKAGIGSTCRPLVRSAKTAPSTCRLRNELREIARRERYKERSIKADLDSGEGDATGALPHVVAMRKC